jgi:hypothetical protein
VTVCPNEGLIARVRRIRRAAAAADEPPARSSTDPATDHIRRLEDRIEHLEQRVQGLQDSVHRESLRHSKRIAALEVRTQSAALGKALSQDARARGL